MTQLIRDVLPTLVTASLLFGLSLFAPRLPTPRLARRAVSLLARNTPLALTFVALFSFTVASAVTRYLGVPIPRAHDEFSYLLAADTFSSGRLTNPTHPMWPYFETFHVIHRPTYMSKYPPGQGLALALGQVLGHPIIGAWLSTAAACVALTWSFFAWLPARWALLGGILAPLHPMILLWSQLYWGGSVALMGGALVAGAIRRLAVNPRPRDGWLLSLGIAILANSRPYEGAVLTLFALAALFIQSRGDSIRRIATAIGVPLVVVGLLTGGMMMVYNFRVTGDPLLMPYVVHERQYSVAPVFIFQSPRAVPQYRHAEIRRHHVEWELPLYQLMRTPGGFLRAARDNVLVLIRAVGRLFIPKADAGPVRAYVGFLPHWFSGILIISLVALPAALKRDPWLRASAAMLALFTLALLPIYWTAPHYAAPVAPFAGVLLIASMRQLNAFRWRDRPSGRFLVRVVVLAWLLSFVVSVRILARPETPQWAPVRYRAAFIEALERAGGRHLIIVRYSPHHFVHFEWVYNEANIDASSVVWARDMGQTLNRRLVEYFRDRRIWLLNADERWPQLIPYKP